MADECCRYLEVGEVAAGSGRKLTRASAPTSINASLPSISFSSSVVTHFTPSVIRRLQSTAIQIRRGQLSKTHQHSLRSKNFSSSAAKLATTSG